MKITGAEALIKSLLLEKVEVIFGYPGGAIMPVYDALYHYQDKIKHILVRHEQGAVHAAEGYARISRKPGVCFTTSGPGATNLVTGIADAMMDSVPLVCITGQVASSLLGSDAFQETDVIGITTPITKWNYQIINAQEIPEIISKAFYIASKGRPGPVVIDITKNAQIEELDYKPKKIFIEKLEKTNKLEKNKLKEIAEIINSSEKPLIVAGHGVLISNAENELNIFSKKAKIPIAVTLHGVSSTNKDNPYYVGMVGMHGNYAPNVLTNEADLLLGFGMRFDDRVTGKLDRYAKNAKIIHVDIDASEHNKNVKTYFPVLSDLKYFLKNILPYIKSKNRKNWIEKFKQLDEIEKKYEKKRYKKYENKITSDLVIKKLSELTKGKAIVVADVGQNQMFAARYYDFKLNNSFISSGGLGTMGFSLPASIGAKIASKNDVYAVVGDGGFQMTIQELGTIMQEKLPIKILILNNQYLGMVRQWQELFFSKRYSFTYLKNPNFIQIAQGYNIQSKKINKKQDLEKELKKFIKSKKPYVLEVMVEAEHNVFPMIPAGNAVDEIRLE
ncbi:MAG: biosynthetic-type acetolactate synthase large subunit [Patescibacteria group bacterium]|nr:biosynthetic-type acetolactate synthase large subunit [Patescibacteria group bacterium]